MFDYAKAAQETIARLWPRVAPQIADAEAQATFKNRLDQHLPRALQHLHRLYGDQYDFFYHLEQIVHTLAVAFAERNTALHALDHAREADPFWFKRADAVGAVCYIDLFADNLNGIREKISYFKELGITYLHLMPLFLTPLDESDGGYAISDFRQVNPALGTMAQLAELATYLRLEGISLVIDFVFNHTADDHPWTQQALNGDEDHLDFYYTFVDRTLPDRYEQNLREIFPQKAPGNFTYNPTLGRWVWTTFNSFQWDLNYGNQAVFNAMLGEMLFLANQGVEVLRLDAVAFIWKRMGTPCENLPEVHDIIRAFNALVRIAAPAMLFKSEAIVHPRDVASYIDWEEAPLSYNPTFMATIWEALATREVQLLRQSMTHHYAIPQATAWINYVRVHDDIGWSFADEDAAQLGINGFDHRQFLNTFYTGRFEGSFARGVGFNYNPITRDMRINGTAASLAGLEQALEQDDATRIDLAIKRIILIHSLIIAAGGVPLLYLGDEIATLNDYSYQDDPMKADDSRWVHRPHFDWQRAEKRHDAQHPAGRVFQAITHLIAVRKASSQLHDERTQFFDTQNPHVLGFVRNKRVLVLANFSEEPQPIRRDVLTAYWSLPMQIVDLARDEQLTLSNMFTLEPYQFVWLAPDKK